jgi:hypothetical protein
MHEPASGLFKVGVAMSQVHARKRSKALAKQRKHPVTILLWRDWPHTEEQRLHRYLWESWAEGEWFKDSPELQEVITYLRDNAYGRWVKAFRAAEPNLPPAWRHYTRDKILSEKQKGAI